MSGHHPISDLLDMGKINQTGRRPLVPERLTCAADIVELTLELQKLIAKENAADKEAIKLLQNKLAEMIFEADPVTLEGTIECLSRMVQVSS
jgi:hypothetical protein